MGIMNKKKTMIERKKK